MFDMHADGRLQIIIKRVLNNMQSSKAVRYRVHTGPRRLNGTGQRRKGEKCVVASSSWERLA